MKLEINGLSKNFGDLEILKDINFSVIEGEFLSILGSSGCGKTTLLRIIAGIENQDLGEIYKEGMNISKLDPLKRGIGFIFQNYALFPNMTVLENVRYPLKIRKNYDKNPTEEAMKILENVGLSKHLKKRPHQLSGGQQQRVAIARTLALSPDVILLDEPLSALDAETRLILRKELKRIQRDFGVTMIYVTHDQEEAITMSDRILVMDQGEIAQLDTPENIYKYPSSPYVEKFVVYHMKEKLAAFQNFLEGMKDEK